MSDEMAVGDNATSDESKVNSDDTAVENVDPDAETSINAPAMSPIEETKEAVEPKEDAKEDSESTEEIEEKLPTIKEESTEDNTKDITEDVKEENTKDIKEENFDEEKRVGKRRASAAFSDADEEFKGFDLIKHDDLCGEYNRVLERLETEVQMAIKDLKPVRSFKAAIAASARASKRSRQDTADGSRPSSALSSRSDGEWTETASGGSWAGSLGVRGRRSTTEMSSPLLRAPLERGWRRELVFRAALDAHSRRNADIYYYTPHGKKLRSTREVAEHLSGTGLTLENFSFFKEPLGVDDPEKEIIRDAKLMRRVESPVPAPPPVTEGKRTPKPKAPKGASPEPPTLKSPPSKLKVKSLGSRLSNNGTPPAASAPKQLRRPAPATASAPATAPATAPTVPSPADNNNSSAWKKPRAAGATLPPPLAASPAHPLPPVAMAAAAPPAPPPPLQSRPTARDADAKPGPRQMQLPCSMSCGDGAVPSLACVACLCLYHPACVGVPHHHQQNFLCKNCKECTSPPLEPPPLTHKSGTTAGVSAPNTRRASNAPAPVPVPAKVRPDKRVLLRMKVAGGGADGSRVWAVAGSTAGSAPAVRPTQPQSLAVLNGRRFIVVPRSLVNSDHR